MSRPRSAYMGAARGSDIHKTYKRETYVTTASNAKAYIPGTGSYNKENKNLYAQVTTPYLKKRL